MENQSFIELIVIGCSIDMFDRQGIMIIPMNFVSLHALHSSFLVWSTLFASFCHQQGLRIKISQGRQAIQTSQMDWPQKIHQLAMSMVPSKLTNRPCQTGWKTNHFHLAMVFFQEPRSRDTPTSMILPLRMLHWFHCYRNKLPFNKE